MKNFKIFFLLVAVTAFGFTKAQKIGVVDTDYILNKLPQYKDAEGRLNAQVTTWQSEIASLQSDYEKKKAAFENERVLLVGDQLRAREKEVTDLEKNIKTTISLRFGTNGEISKLRENLVQPFQDQIWNAIKTVSEKNQLGIVLDKANNVNVIFLQKRYDYTDKVLDLILRGTTEKEKPAGKSGKK